MMRKNNVLRKYIASLLLFLLFETVAITLWKAKRKLVLSVEFQLHWRMPCVGNSTFYCRKTLCPTFSWCF